MSEVPTESDEAMADWLIKLYQDKVSFVPCTVYLECSLFPRLPNFFGG